MRVSKYTARFKAAQDRSYHHAARLNSAKGTQPLAPRRAEESNLKGVKGGNCNVTACQKPGATFYNKSTRRYYCGACAKEINWPGGWADCKALYGVPLLCEEDPV